MLLSSLRPLAVACVSVVVLSNGVGCQSSPTFDDLPARLAASAGLAEPIQFSSVGEPVDLPPSSAAPTLTLPTAVEQALRHSPAVQSAAARVRIALADAQQTRLLPNPVLSVVLRFPEAGGKPQIEAGLTQELLSLLQRPRQVSAADARLRAAAAEAVDTTLDVLAETEARYLTWQAAEAEQATLADRRKLIDRLVDVTDARVKAGESSRLDLLVLAAQRAELDADIVEKDAAQTDERLAMLRLIGRPSSDAVPTLSTFEPARAVGTESQWIAAALRHRPDLEAQRWELAALGDEATLARLAWLEGDAGLAAERDDQWSLGPAVNLPLPLFDWGQAQRERAAARVVEARHQFTEKQRKAIEDVRRALAAWQAAERVSRLIETQVVPLQEQRRAQAETQYRNGAADISALLLAEQDALESRMKLVRGRSNLAQAYLRLVRAAGGHGAVAAIEWPTPATQPSTH